MTKFSININNLVFNEFNIPKKRAEKIKRIIEVELEKLIKQNGLPEIPTNYSKFSGKSTLTNYKESANDFQLARGIADGIYGTLYQSV